MVQSTLMKLTRFLSPTHLNQKFHQYEEAIIIAKDILNLLWPPTILSFSYSQLKFVQNLAVDLFTCISYWAVDLALIFVSRASYNVVGVASQLINVDYTLISVKVALGRSS